MSLVGSTTGESMLLVESKVCVLHAAPRVQGAGVQYDAVVKGV
jgi:hypothetical protein